MPPLYFNTTSGKLVESEYLPQENHSQPGQWSLLADLIVTEELSYSKTDFPSPESRYWDEEYVRKIGRLISEDLANGSPPRGLTKSIVNRLASLGIFPTEHYFWSQGGHYQGLLDFRKQIGVNELVRVNHMHRNAEYKNLSIDEFIKLILDRYNDLFEQDEGAYYDGPVTTNIIEAMNRIDLAPGLKYITKTYGGLRQINEHIGFPDIASWDNHDYIAFGADVIRFNGYAALTVPNIWQLSAQHLGPNYTGIDERFGWARFKDLAREEFIKQETLKQSHEEVVRNYYSQNVVDAETSATVEEMARHRALWILVGHFRPKNAPIIPARPDMDTVTSVIQTIKNGNLSQADIETTAYILNVGDDLWPARRLYRPPIIQKNKKRKVL